MKSESIKSPSEATESTLVADQPGLLLLQQSYDPNRHSKSVCRRILAKVSQKKRKAIRAISDCLFHDSLSPFMLHHAFPPPPLPPPLPVLLGYYPHQPIIHPMPLNELGFFVAAPPPPPFPMFPADDKMCCPLGEVRRPIYYYNEPTAMMMPIVFVHPPPYPPTCHGDPHQLLPGYEKEQKEE